MTWSSTLFLSLLLQICTVTLINKRWDDFIEKHSWQEIPNGWQFHSNPSPNDRFNLTLGLKQNNFDSLLNSLLEVSDPFHENYGKHLSKEQVNAFSSPSPSTVAVVGDWLSYHGVDTSADISRNDAGDWITITVSVKQAERMLNAKYTRYHHPHSSDYVVRTMAYSLPRVLHSHIRTASPTTYFSTLRSMRVPVRLSQKASLQRVQAATQASGCSDSVNPACLQTFYNTTGYIPRASKVNKIGVTGYLKEWFNYEDLKGFLKQYRPDAVNVTVPAVLINGGQNNQTMPGVEANLDVQYTVALTFPTPNIFYSTGGSPPFTPDGATPDNTNEPYLQWVNFILKSSHIPQTISTSYGDDEQTVPKDYAESVCNSFAKLGSMGTTLLFSSGDSGVGGDECLNNDGTNTTSFQPAFPASCPWVTAVGGTTGSPPEVAWEFSGSGFSRYFNRPSYQDKSVSSYLARLGTQNKGLFNPRGRAYPDISAHSTNFEIFMYGRKALVDGTSASAPTAASIIALLNDARLAAGKSPLGFLNPLIYSKGASAFNDITSGDNPGCGTNGFPATPGWDPVTGLGTPNFLKLKQVVLGV